MAPDLDRTLTRHRHGRRRPRRRIGLAAAGLAASGVAFGVWSAVTTERAQAENFLLDNPVVIAAQEAVDAEWQLEFFSTYENVREIIDDRPIDTVPLRVPLPFVEDWVDVDAATANIYLDDAKRSLSVQVHVNDLGPIGQAVPEADILVAADWEDVPAGADDPVITVVVRAANVELLDLADVTEDLGAGVTLHLEDGWILYSNTAQPALDVDALPAGIAPFFDPIDTVTNDLLPGNAPLVLDPQRANFYGDISLAQEPELDRAVSLAGVTTANLRVHGTIGADASILFDEDSLAEPFAFDVTASVDATGTDAPPWLVGRTFTAQLSLTDLLEPELEIGDVIDTVAGEAHNVFTRGFSFDAADFGSLPLQLDFDLVTDAFEEPFGIDVPALLGAGALDPLDIGLTLGVTVEVSDPDVITGFDATVSATFPGAIGGPVTVSIHLQVDPEHLVVVGEFTVDLDLSVQEVVSAVAGAVGVPSFDTGPAAGLTIDQISLVARRIADTTDVTVSASLGALPDVLGFDWLDLNDLTVSLKVANGIPDEALFDHPVFTASLTADVDVAGTNWTTRLDVEASDGAAEASINLSLGDGESLDLSGLVGLFQQGIGGGDGDFDLGAVLAAVQLQDLSVTLRAGTDGASFDAITRVVLPASVLGVSIDATAYVRAASPTGPGQPLQFFLGFRPTSGVSLSQIVAVPGLEGVTLPNLGLIFSTAPVAGTADELSTEGFHFFNVLFGCLPDAPQPTALNPDAGCGFQLKLDPGLNIVANVQLPPALFDLAEVLWMDPARGMQFLGTVTAPIPGPGTTASAGLALEISLPEVNPPPDIDFLERGALSLGVRLKEDLSVGLFIEGELDTRWRRSEPNPGSCDLGELMTGVDIVDDEAVTNQYCYDRLRFRLTAELTLSTSKIEFNLSGQLLSLDEVGWQQPFGIEWLTIRSLTLQFGVEVAGPSFSSPTFTIGFGGDIILGDPDNGGKRLAASLAVGVTIVNPAPTPAGIAATPAFGGVRAYVSSLGMTDLVALYQLVTGGAAPPIPDIPLAEIRNAEFMFALENNEALCLEQGIAVAGELFLLDAGTPPATAVIPPTDENGCAPFGALVDPETCTTTRRDDGCFASVLAEIQPTGILIDGAVGAIELGPVSFDDARMRLAMLPGDASFVLRGGVTVGPFVEGHLSVALDSTGFEFYGFLTMFDLFLVQVDAKVDFEGLSLLDPLPDVTFDAVLQSDFDEVAESALASKLTSARTFLADLETKWTAVKNATGEKFAAKVTALFDLVGLDVPGWVSDVTTAFNTFDTAAQDAIVAAGDVLGINVNLPTLSEFISGGEGSVTYLNVFCGFDKYDKSENACVNDDGEEYAPTVPPCVPLFEAYTNNGDPRCRFVISTPGIDIPGLPDSLDAVLQDFAGKVADKATATVLAIQDFVANPSLTELFDAFLGDELDVPDVFSIECASFEFDTADGGSNVGAQLRIGLLGETYGFDYDLDLSEPDFVTMFAQLMDQYLSNDPQSIECIEELTPPAGVDPAPPAELTTTARPSRIAEGGSVTLEGDFTTDPGTAAVTVDWGDGSPIEDVAVEGTEFSIAHVYRDDPAGITPTYTLRVFVDGVGQTTHRVGVDNARPVLAAFATPSRIDEGTAVTLTVVATDAGILDTHTATIGWGDGATETVELPLAAPLTHTYADDDPHSATDEDELKISVHVTDHDGGTDDETLEITVVNVDPTITSRLPAAAVEGSVVTLPVTWTDPGEPDTYTIRITWGDGTITTATPEAGVRSQSFTHTFIDDNPTNTPFDDKTIAVRVTDDDTGTDVTSRTIRIHDAAPASVVANLSATTIDEFGSVTVSGSFTDAGVLDTHTVEIDWGDPALGTTTLTLPFGTYTFSATQQYGDNSRRVPATPFTITATVRDDDTLTGSASAALTVRNVNPDAAIDRTGSRVVNGNPTFFTQVNTPVTFNGSATDPGSDDLLYAWALGVSSPTGTSLVPGQSGADPEVSPSVRPRTGADAFAESRTVTYVNACLVEVRLTVTDDDTGADSDRVYVIVVDDETLRRTAGYWKQQYTGRGGAVLPTALRQCYLDIANFLSARFEGLTFARAEKILTDTKTSLQQLERQLLAAWLNVANGSLGYDQLVDTNNDGTVDTPFSVFAAAVEGRMATASNAQRTADAAVLERINSSLA